MEACPVQKRPGPPDGGETAPQVAQWLLVSGDLDDLIYYDQPQRQSER